MRALQRHEVERMVKHGVRSYLFYQAGRMSEHKKVEDLVWKLLNGEGQSLSTLLLMGSALMSISLRAFQLSGAPPHAIQNIIEDGDMMGAEQLKLFYAKRRVNVSKVHWGPILGTGAVHDMQPFLAPFSESHKKSDPSEYDYMLGQLETSGERN